MGEREKDVGDKAGFLLNFEHVRADVVGQILELWDGMTGDCTRLGLS